MKRRILLIITTLLIVALGLIGITYLISYKNNSLAKSEYESTNSSIPENIVNTIANETEQALNEIEETKVDESTEAIVEEVDEVEQEIVETKQETQTPTQTKSNTSNNNVNKTQKQETKVQSTQTSTPVTTTATSTPASTPTQTTPLSTETKKEETKVERCTNNHNHFIDVGNSGKWFSSKDAAIAYYNQQTKYWSDYLDNCEAGKEDEAWEVYKKNCPSGHEEYNCIYCNKWTINFNYRNY